nr:GMC oxidoreductase [Nocardioides marmoriginsengisoli]
MTGKTFLERADGFTVYTVLLHPQGRGRVVLRDGSPAVDFQLLGHAGDRRKLVVGADLARSLVEDQSAMRHVVGAYDSPADRAGTRWLARSEESIAHPVGTCRMGMDDDAVVNRS